jgi:tetratricopeptide (TPR) repeat protein
VRPPDQRLDCGARRRRGGGDLLERGAEALPSSKQKAELLGTLAVYHEDKADFERAIDAMQRAVAAVDTATNADAKVRLRYRKDLAKVFLNAQRYAECIALLRDIEPQVVAEFGEFSEQNGDLLDTLALALSRSEKAEEALNAAQQSLEIFQEVEGENSLRAARVLGILMPGIYSAVGQTEMREVVQRRALKMFEARSEELDPGAITNYSVVLGNLGSTLADRGELAEAEQLMVRALDQKIRINGDRANPAFIPILVKLGGVCGKAGKFKSAEHYATNAVKICGEYLGDSHAETQKAKQLLDMILNDPRRQA